MFAAPLLAATIDGNKVDQSRPRCHLHISSLSSHRQRHRVEQCRKTCRAAMFPWHKLKKFWRRKLGSEEQPVALNRHRAQFSRLHSITLLSFIKTV